MFLLGVCVVTMSDGESDIEIQQGEYEEQQTEEKRLYYPTTAAIRDSKYKFLPESGSLVIEDKEGKHYKTNGIDRVYWMMYGGTPERKILVEKQCYSFMILFLMGFNMLSGVFGIIASAGEYNGLMAFFIIALVVNVILGPVIVAKSMKSEIRFKAKQMARK